MQPQNLNDLVILAKKKKPKKLVVVAADDIHLLKALKESVDENIAEPILIGSIERFNSISNQINLNLKEFEIIDISDPIEASKYAIKLINENRAEVLMKGMVSTAILMRAILDKQHGLPYEGLLSHFAIVQTNAYHKLLSISDVSLNIKPSLEEKKKIIDNSLNVMYKLDYNNPKIALLCPIEIVNPKIESTLHAAALKNIWEKGEFKKCIIDGPLALDNAISKNAAIQKGIKSEVAGDVDLLIVPDLNSGNILYKSLSYFAGACNAAIVTGASVPIVLTSRTDSEKSKFFSIALASCL